MRRSTEPQIIWSRKRKRTILKSHFKRLKPGLMPPFSADWSLLILFIIRIMKSFCELEFRSSCFWFMCMHKSFCFVLVMEIKNESPFRQGHTLLILPCLSLRLLQPLPVTSTVTTTFTYSNCWYYWYYLVSCIIPGPDITATATTTTETVTQGPNNITGISGTTECISTQPLVWS